MSTIPKPESEGRGTCRVEGCGELVAPLLTWPAPSGEYHASSSMRHFFNHGFCRLHLLKIAPAFERRWAAAQNQFALERLWRTIADDLTIEEATRGKK